MPGDKFRKAEELIFEYQRKRLEATYADVDGLDDMRELFFGMIYPPPVRRRGFEERNRAFVRTTRNRLLRLVCNRPVIDIMEETVELNELTERINRDMAVELCKFEKLPDALDDEVYFSLSKKVSTYKERLRQLKCAVDGFKLALIVVLYFPMNLSQIIRFFPKRLIGNDELYDLAVAIYNVLYNHRSDLHGYLELMEKRETERMKIMFGITD